MTPRRLLLWAAIGLISGVALFVLEALIGLNYFPEGDPLAWFLRALQWLAIALVIASAAAASWAMLLLFRGSRQAVLRRFVRALKPT